jgi:nicotinate-nucleotide--dimethylbenzimidazole phosphoribosyltransferase
MSSEHGSLISPTTRPALEQALRLKLSRRSETTGSLGELEPLAVRLGLIQNSLRPKLRQPQLLVFAGDHGLAVDVNQAGGRSTAQLVYDIVASRVPLSVFAHNVGMSLNVVDSGVAEPLAAHPGLMLRKIAHGTRNCRVAQAMSVEQVHAAIRAGMEIADNLPGSVLACAGIGVGSHEAAALVLARILGLPIRDMLISGPSMPPERVQHLTQWAQAALNKHANVIDPVEVLAAFGGFETAMMVGAMLVASSKRHLLMADGMSACAALVVASRIAAPATDYCVFCRSHTHQGLDTVLQAFDATALLELGMNSTDGTGAALAWPLVRAAAALLTEVSEGEDPGPSVIGEMRTEAGVPINSGMGVISQR